MRLGHARQRAVHGRTVRERGAAILELAICATFLITLVAGAFDFGMGWRSALAMNEGVRGGARVGSGMGKDLNTDRLILTSLQSTLSASGLYNRVDRVVIFEALGTGGKPSNTCIAGTGGDCNTFSGTQFRAATASSPITSDGCITNAMRAFWCPGDRNDVQEDSQYVGVWVRATHDYLFPIFGDTVTITRSAVMRIEP